MKKVKRNNIWETNSSSQHSLVVDKSGLEESNLPINKDGYIVAHYGDFGREKEIYSDQESKLSYLLSQCYYLSRLPEEDKFGKIDDAVSDYYYESIVEAVLNYDNRAKGIEIIGPEPEIDHQSIPYGGDMNLVNYWDEEDVQQFIFNKYISLKTDSD